jgi:hypothetical protein
MNAPIPTDRSHSADVHIQLLVDGRVLSVAQLGPDFLVLRSPAAHPACDGEILLRIDGQESRWPVHLADGVRPAERKTRITHNGSATE